MRLVHEKYREIEESRRLGALRSLVPPGEGRARFSPVFRDSRVMNLPLPPERVFEPIRRIGGAVGWYYADWLWSIRGWMDRLVGGIGMRRGRRDPEVLEVGDAVDCWRVEAFEADRSLLLALEMTIPGRGWLEFDVSGDDSASTVRLTATYEAGGLAGCIYWYLSYPFHEMLFTGMLRGISAAALSARDRRQLSQER